MITNYKEFKEFLNDIPQNKEKPTLLIHSCCGPCSSHVLALLNQYFQITIFYYNPNIYPLDEYVRREEEQERLISYFSDVGFIRGLYDSDKYFSIVDGLESEREGGRRCYKCISMRMEEACKYAKENGYDFFTTTLSVSPHKNSRMINEIGYALEKEYNVSYLYSDFKKKDGYKRSIFLSNKYNLYRQDYCGCKYSARN